MGNRGWQQRWEHVSRVNAYNTIAMLRRVVLALVICLSTTLAQAAPRPNIFLITLHSARADSMGFWGAKRKGLTPNLDRLAAESIVFQRAYAQAPATVPSAATILTGLYPQTHQVGDVGMPLSASLPYLPDLLHARGYRTAAFVGSSMLDPRAGLAPGFSRSFETYNAPRPAALSDFFPDRILEVPAAEVVRRTTAWLPQNQNAAVLVWISLQDSSADYAKRIAALDTAAGKLITVLKTRKLFDDALIVVAADHGESLGAHGEETHGIFLYDETIHVPLLLKLPRQQMAARQVTARVSLVDIAATVLEVAGVPVPPQMQGQSLLRIVKSSSNGDQPSYSRADIPRRDFGWSALESWRSGNYLLIRAPRSELYDLAADPGATRNLAENRKAVLDTLSAQLENFDRRLTPGTSAGASGLTSSELQKLSSLGYVGLQRPTSSQSSAPSGTDPKDEIARANRVEKAMAALYAGKPAQASAELERIAAEDPKLFLAFYGAGLAQIAQKQYGRAIEPLHKAIALQPDSALAHFAMGLAASHTEDWKTAATHLEIAVVRLPESPLAHQLLSEAYAHLGRTQDAAREKSKATGHDQQ
jgi:choline-sulfatase